MDHSRGSPASGGSSARAVCPCRAAKRKTSPRSARRMRSTKRLHMAHTPSKKMIGCSSDLMREAPAGAVAVAPLVTGSRCQICTTRATAGTGALAPHGALRRSVEVLRQNLRRVRDTLEPGDAAHVHDVRLPFAFDDVDAVQIDAERSTAAHGDVAELRREREGLPSLLGFRSRGKDLLDPEQPATDRVDLAIAALRRVIALGEHGR